MKRNFNVVVKNYDGRPNFRAIMRYDETTGLPMLAKDGRQEFSHHEPMTLRTYAIDALSPRLEGDQNMTVTQARDRTKLLDKLVFSVDGVVELDTTEGPMILDCMLRQGREPYIVARMATLIETDPAPAAIVVDA